MNYICILLLVIEERYLEKLVEKRVISWRVET